MAKSKRVWLMKSEPDVFSIGDLEREGRTGWEGVRNYQARNFMRDEMKTGDLVLFYHSNASPPGVAGLGEICREAYPDDTARDPDSPYYDARSTPDNPVWLRVDVAWKETFPRLVSLDELKACPALEGMMVTRRGMRLSIQPVDPAHASVIRKLARS